MSQPVDCSSNIRPGVSWDGAPALTAPRNSLPRRGIAAECANPFFFGGKITDPTRFVGRKQELRLIVQRMSAAHMTSVGVTGAERIGKSSLLYHIYQTYPQRLIVGALILLLVILRLTGLLPVREFLRWVIATLGAGGGQP